MADDYFRQYGLIAIFIVIALLVPVGMLAISWLASFVRIRPYKFDPVKNSLYECGVQPVGTGRVQLSLLHVCSALCRL